MLDLEVLIDGGIDVVLLFLHVFHLRDWFLLLKNKREAEKKNIIILCSLGTFELFHILADELLYEMHLIRKPFLGIRLILKILAVLSYGVFIATEVIHAYREKKEEKKEK